MLHCPLRPAASPPAPRCTRARTLWAFSSSSSVSRARTTSEVRARPLDMRGEAVSARTLKAATQRAPATTWPRGRRGSGRALRERVAGRGPVASRTLSPPSLPPAPSPPGRTASSRARLSAQRGAASAERGALGGQSAGGSAAARSRRRQRGQAQDGGRHGGHWSVESGGVGSRLFERSLRLCPLCSIVRTQQHQVAAQCGLLTSESRINGAPAHAASRLPAGPPVQRFACPRAPRCLPTRPRPAAAAAAAVAPPQPHAPGARLAARGGW